MMDNFYIILNIYIFVITFTGIFIFIIELLLIDIKIIKSYKIKSQEKYLYNSEQYYNILCLYYDILRYIKNDFKIFDIICLFLLNFIYLVYLVFLPFL